MIFLNYFIIGLVILGIGIAIIIKTLKTQNNNVIPKKDTQEDNTTRSI